MSFRRIPKEIDPRRHPTRKAEESGEGKDLSKARSYGQYVDLSKDNLDELEDVTDEVAREGATGDDVGDGSDADRTTRRKVENREAFEDAIDEVSREDGEPHR